MDKGIAFIGTRDLGKVSRYQMDVYLRAVEVAVKSGYHIITGGAVGCDQYAATGGLLLGGFVDLKLPWGDYEYGWHNAMCAQYPGKVSIEIYNPSLPLHQSWRDSVNKYHPNFSKLTRGSLAVQARNYGIVSNARSVIAISNPNKVGGGGTGQGIRIAKAIGITCYDLSVEEEAISLERYIDKAWERMEHSQGT